MKKLNKKGFTLIELIVVIGILAVLAVILIPSIINYVGQAEDAAGLANARSAYSAAALAVATEDLADDAAVEAAILDNVPGLVAADIIACVDDTATTNVTQVTNVIYGNATDGYYSFPTTGLTACP
jgi:type IV pilus assembly protein PilA